MSAPLQILLPVYNAERYLEQALDSIVEQTYTDWELLAIDDGSTDSSLTILEGFSARDERVQVRSQQNVGLIKTLHRLIEWSSSPILARMDADDISHKQRLEKQIALFDSSNDMLVGCWAELFGAKKDIWHYREADGDIRMLAFFGRCPMLHASLMGSREVFVKHAFRLGFEHVEDLDFLFRIVLDQSITLANVQQTLYYYRQHSDSVIYQHESARVESYKTRFSLFLKEAGINLHGSELENYLTYVYRPDALKTVAAKDVLASLSSVVAATINEYPNYLSELIRRLQFQPNENQWLIENLSKKAVV